MPQTLKASAQFNEQQREQDVTQQLAPEIEAAKDVLGVDPTEIENDIKGQVGNYKLFGFIPTPADSDVDVDEAKEYLQSRIARQMVEDYEGYVTDGGESSDEDEAVIKQLKDKYQFNKTFVDVAQEMAGDTFHGIAKFAEGAKDTLASDEGRKGLLDNIGSALEKGVQDPAGFLDSLATLSMDTMVDELPTGIAKTASDFNDALHGGKVQSPQELKINMIKNSPFSGHTTEKLSQAQPAAAFIAMMVPYVLRGGLGKAREANALKIIGLPARQLEGTVAKAARLATAETTLDAATSSMNTVEGKNLRERNKARAANAAITFFSSIGIDLAGGQIQKMYKNFTRQGMPKTEAIQATVEEIQNQLDEVQMGERPVDMAKVDADLDKYSVDPDAITNKPVETEKGRVFVSGTGEEIQKGERKALPAGTKQTDEIAKMNAKQLQAALKDTSGMERRLRTLGHSEVEAKRRVGQAQKALQKRTTQILTTDENKGLVKDAKRLLSESAQDVTTAEVKNDAKNIGRNVSDAQAKALANEKATRKGMEAKIKQVQTRRAKTFKEEQTANVKASQETKETFQQAKIDPIDSDAKVVPIDSVDVPFEGNFMDQLTARTGRFGLAGLNILREQTPRLRETINTYIDAFSSNKRYVASANERATVIYNDFAKTLGVDPKTATKQYLDSGMYRAWVEGLVKDGELKPKELVALKQLKKAEVEYNKLNLELIEANGTDTTRFNPEAFTDSSRGDKFVTIELTDNAELRGQVEAAGFKVTEVGPTKQNPDIKPRSFVVVDYGNSGTEILANMDEARFYYQRKAPFMFDDSGNLKKDIFQDNTNISKQLYELSQETTLTPDQVSNIRGQLIEQGYPASEINEIVNDISRGNVDMTKIKQKIQKVFAGSLQRSEGSKIGVKPDVVNARRLQNIDLTKKLYRDTMNAKIAEQKSAVNKFIVANPKLTDNQRFLLKNELFSMDRIGEMVNNKPDLFEKMILNAMDSVGIGLDNKLFKKYRNVTDQFLHVQSALKLSFNVSGSAMNCIEALRATLDAGIEIPEQTWERLFNGVKNPIKFENETEAKMAKSTKYKEFYLEQQYDASVDTRFKGKKNLATTITDNGVVKVGMAPFTGSIRWGKTYAYNIGEALGQTKGLKGEVLDDFIFDFMAKRGQIQDLNISAMGKNGTVAKSVLWLKNFMLRTSEYEIDGWRRLAGSVMKRKVDKAAAAQVFAFTVVPTAVFGLGASPTVSLLNGLVSGGTGVGNFITQFASGGEAPNWHVDPLRDALAAGKGTLPGFLGRGIVGEMLGMSTRQMAIDPVSGFSQMPVSLQFLGDTGKLTMDSFFNAGVALETGDMNDYIATTVKGLDAYAAKQVTGYGRAKKAASVMQDGVLKSVNGIPLEKGIPENLRPLRAFTTSLGFNSATSDREYAKQEKGREIIDGKKLVKKAYTELAAKYYKAGNTKKGDEILDIAGKKGFDVGEKAIENALDRMEKTSTERFRERLTDEQVAQLEEDAPEVLETPEEPEEPEEDDNLDENTEE